MLVSIPQAQIFFLALTRVMAVIIHIPFLGGQLIPNPIKIGLGFMLTMVVIPWNTVPVPEETIPVLAYAFDIGREIVIGTLAGFAAALIFAMVEIAGEMMSLGAGFSAGKILNPVFQNSSSSLNQIVVMFGATIFLVINGHHEFIAGLQRTFQVVPVNSPLPVSDAAGLITLTSTMITSGIQLALPVVGALLLTDFIMGLLARVAPQLHVFFLGLPLKIGVGLIVILLSFSLMLPNLTRIYGYLGTWMTGLVGN